LLVVPLLLGVVLTVGAGVRAHNQAGAATPRVGIVDNDGSNPPPNLEATGYWGFFPHHITVTKGESITFDNPAGNFRPHTVTSITWEGTAPTRTLASGARFDSSPTREMLVMPGSSFTLDTTDLEPANYLYYCTLHPWMVGTFTVVAAP
jgi:plastocyanin